MMAQTGQIYLITTVRHQTGITRKIQITWFEGKRILTTLRKKQEIALNNITN